MAKDRITIKEKDNQDVYINNGLVSNGCWIVKTDYACFSNSIFEPYLRDKKSINYKISLKTKEISNEYMCLTHIIPRKDDKYKKLIKTNLHHVMNKLDLELFYNDDKNYIVAIDSKISDMFSEDFEFYQSNKDSVIRVDYNNEVVGAILPYKNLDNSFLNNMRLYKKSCEVSLC